MKEATVERFIVIKFRHKNTVSLSFLTERAGEEGRMDGEDVDMAAAETTEAVPVSFFPYFSSFLFFYFGSAVIFYWYEVLNWFLI